MTITVTIKHNEPENPASVFVRVYMWHKNLNGCGMQIYELKPGESYTGYLHKLQTVEVIEEEHYRAVNPSDS